MARRMLVRPRPDRDARSEPFELFTRPQRSRPARLLGLAIRMRAELTATIVAVTAWLWLTERMDERVAGAAVLLVAATVAAVGPSRRFVVRRVYAVRTRHRLRAVCVERRIMNYSGNLPIQVWSRPTAVGERVWLLLRAGIDLIDIQRNLDYVASGCFARDARAEAHRSLTTFVVVDVIRRDPLSAAGPLPSTFTPRPPAPPRLQLVARKGA
jgi:hypothetical protein